MTAPKASEAVKEAAEKWANGRVHADSTVGRKMYEDGFEAGARWAFEAAAQEAFEKVRCDDRTDRWQVANEVAAHIRALATDAGDGT